MRKATPEVRSADLKRKRKATFEARGKDLKHKAKVKCAGSELKASQDARKSCTEQNATNHETEDVERNSTFNQLDDRINVFKTAIKEGPYYICVICNRCLYKKTVKHFKGILP